MSTFWFIMLLVFSYLLTGFCLGRYLAGAYFSMSREFPEEDRRGTATAIGWFSLFVWPALGLWISIWAMIRRGVFSAPQNWMTGRTYR